MLYKYAYVCVDRPGARQACIECIKTIFNSQGPSRAVEIKRVTSPVIFSAKEDRVISSTDHRIRFVLFDPFARCLDPMGNFRDITTT